MDDHQLLRYGRHILLPQIGIEGQERLARSRVLVVGLGGLGSPVAMYLAASGIGRLTLADDDSVELSNLQRQIVHTTASLGEAKVESAQRSLRALNPEIEIATLHERLRGDALERAVADADVVVDGSDNFTTRFALNRACVQHRRPLVSGAVIRTEGQVTVFVPGQPGSPCYRCLYQETDEPGEPCAERGVLAPVAGIIGCLQATETLKILLGMGEALIGRLLVLDALSMQWRSVRLKQDPSCPVCSHAPSSAIA